MKKVCFLTLALGSTLISCNHKVNNEVTNPQTQQTDTVVAATDTTTVQTSDNNYAAVLYACPMHPEVQGKKGDECPKCGMKLTEPVSK